MSRLNTVSNEDVPESMQMVDLPIELIDEIFSYLKFHTVSEIRVVNKRFNEICSTKLNKGFNSITKRHGELQKKVKVQLPRRESDRRKHHLARHVDILSAVETRLSLLNMTYMKYIENKVACFIPGKVLDELNRVLRVASTFDNNHEISTHELLQELRDISSMAMEHFEDKIVPTVKQNIPSFPLVPIMDFTVATIESPIVSPSLAIRTPLSMGPFTTPPRTTPPPSQWTLASDVQVLQQQARVQNNCLQLSRRCITDMRAKSVNMGKKISEQDKALVDHRKIINEQRAQIAELFTRLAAVENCVPLKSMDLGLKTAPTFKRAPITSKAMSSVSSGLKFTDKSGDGLKKVTSDGVIITYDVKSKIKNASSTSGNKVMGGNLSYGDVNTGSQSMPRFLPLMPLKGEAESSKNTQGLIDIPPKLPSDMPSKSTSVPTCKNLELCSLNRLVHNLNVISNNKHPDCKSKAKEESLAIIRKLKLSVAAKNPKCRVEVLQELKASLYGTSTIDIDGPTGVELEKIKSIIYAFVDGAPVGSLKDVVLEMKNILEDPSVGVDLSKEHHNALANDDGMNTRRSARLSGMNRKRGLETDYYVGNDVKSKKKRN